MRGLCYHQKTKSHREGTAALRRQAKLLMPTVLNHLRQRDMEGLVLFLAFARWICLYSRGLPTSFQLGGETCAHLVRSTWVYGWRRNLASLMSHIRLVGSNLQRLQVQNPAITQMARTRFAIRPLSACWCFKYPKDQQWTKSFHCQLTASLKSPKA